MNLRISPPCLSIGSAMASKYWFRMEITSSRGRRSDSFVKFLRSQIMIAAFTGTPLPRVVAPSRICSPACGPT